MPTPVGCSFTFKIRIISKSSTFSNPKRPSDLKSTNKLKCVKNNGISSITLF